MAKGKRKKQQIKDAKMEEDGIGEPAADNTAMDTGNFGDKPSGLHKVCQPGLKQRQAKRGARSTKQKRRQASKLDKALVFAGRFDVKAASVEPKKQAMKQVKLLWSNK